MSWKTRVYLVHRLSAHAFLGFDLRSCLFVCHKCDNPPCFNPNHLFVGTNADNLRDMASKGRWDGPRGEQKPNAKVIEHQVRRIRLMHSLGTPPKIIAPLFGIHPVTVQYILTRRTWAHVA
jgi:hypothetical protein